MICLLSCHLHMFSITSVTWASWYLCCVAATAASAASWGKHPALAILSPLWPWPPALPSQDNLYPWLPPSLLKNVEQSHPGNKKRHSPHCINKVLFLSCLPWESHVWDCVMEAVIAQVTLRTVIWERWILHTPPVLLLQLEAPCCLSASFSFPYI